MDKKQLTRAQRAMRKANELLDELEERDDPLQHKAHEVAEYLQDHFQDLTDQ